MCSTKCSAWIFGKAFILSWQDYFTSFTKQVLICYRKEFLSQGTWHSSIICLLFQGIFGEKLPSAKTALCIRVKVEGNSKQNTVFNFHTYPYLNPFLSRRIRVLIINAYRKGLKLRVISWIIYPVTPIFYPNPNLLLCIRAQVAKTCQPWFLCLNSRIWHW